MNNVKLHKVTIFVVDTGNLDEQALDKLQGDCHHNCGAHIVEIKTAELNRSWNDDDPLNQTSNITNRNFLESIIRKHGENRWTITRSNTSY